MNVTVTNSDSTVTEYAFEPTPGRLVALEAFYRNLFRASFILGFEIKDVSGAVVSHRSI